MKKILTILTILIIVAGCGMTEEEKINKIVELENQALEHWANLEIKESVNKYKEIIALNPHEIDKYYCEIGKTYELHTDKNKEPNYQEAIKAYSLAIKHNSNNDNVFFNRGQAKIHISQYKSAIEDFNQAIKLNQYHYGAIWSRGDCNFELGNYKNAITDLTTVIKYNYNVYSPSLYYQRGLAKIGLYDTIGACSDFVQIQPSKLTHIYEEYLDTIIKYCPFNKDYTIDDYYKMGLYENRNNHFESSIKYFSKVIEMEPNHYESFRYRGDAKSSLGNNKGALTDYNKSINLVISLGKPDDYNCTAYYYRGTIKYNIGDKVGACSDWSMCADNDMTEKHCN
jgi:tetratricopeptide (TPR) repeat protein